jgi:hypothetical protein
MAMSDPPAAQSAQTVTDTGSGPGQSDGKVWMRRWQLLLQKAPIAGGKSATTLDLSELHIEFSVEQGLQMSPWHAVIKVENVGRDLMTEAIKEFTSVSLSAGYETPAAQYGEIFSGRIAYYRRGRETPTETFLEITANNWNPNVTRGVMNTWLPPGYTKQDVAQAVADAMGLRLGYFPKGVLDQVQNPRGRTIWGNGQEPLRDITQSVGATSYIDRSGNLNILQAHETLPGPAFKLNSGTGMIGIPVQELGGGIRVVCLLNPLLQVGGAVQINQGDIVQAEAVPYEQGGGGSVSQYTQLERDQAQIAADGIYKVIKITHHGDNRGQPWYSDLLCVPRDPTKQGTVQVSGAGAPQGP